MSSIDLRNPGRAIHVGVVVLSSTTEHLDIAPAGLFACISRDFINEAPPSLIPEELKAQAPDVVTHWVTEHGSIPDDSTPGQLTGNLKFVPTDSFSNCPPLDIVVLGAPKPSHVTSETEKAFLRKCYEDCTAMLCVCAGVLPVLSAGLLEGKSATGPKLMLPLMKGNSPGTEWVEKRWCRDGKIWTSGALLNGFDMVTAFARHTMGGKGSLVDYMIELGAWPERDVNYADVTGAA